LNHQKGLFGFCAILVHVVALDLVNSKCHVIAFWQGFHFVCYVVARGHFWFCNFEMIFDVISNIPFGVEPRQGFGTLEL